MRYFEDLVPGEERVSGTLTVSEPELIEFARRYDPQYFHVDAQAAQASVFGGLVASGIYTMALWRQLDHQIANDIAWICGVQWDDVRFAVAVRPGDTLRAQAKCLSKRPSEKRPERGIVVFQYRLLNQRDEVVFSCRSTNLVERRPERRPPQAQPSP
jgi:acyl dehydratase